MSKKKEMDKYVGYDFIALTYIFGVEPIKHIESFKVLSKINNLNVIINEEGVIGSHKDISKLQLLLAKSVLLN